MNGPRTPQPAIINDMPNAEYHATPALSNTGLTYLADCPAMFYAMMLDPCRPASIRKAGQLEGTLAHCAVLEPDEFDKRYVVTPKGAPKKPTEAQWKAADPSAKSIEAMCWWTDWFEKIGKAEVITADQYETAMRQAESVRKLPEVAELMDSGGYSEQSAFAVCPETGVMLKCRPDRVVTFGSDTGGVILLDLKTYGSANPGEFARQISRKGYYRQQVHYSRTYETASAREVYGFRFVAVAATYPYFASSVMIEQSDADFAYDEVMRLTRLYAKCLEANDWPGYSDKTEIVRLQRYVTNQQGDENE